MNESIDGENIEETQVLASNPTPKKATLTERDGVLGYAKAGEAFQPRTNFNVEVVGCLKMEGSIVGYLIRIKQVDDDSERYLVTYS